MSVHSCMHSQHSRCTICEGMGAHVLWTSTWQRHCKVEGTKPLSQMWWRNLARGLGFWLIRGRSRWHAAGITAHSGHGMHCGRHPLPCIKHFFQVSTPPNNCEEPESQNPGLKKKKTAVDKALRCTGLMAKASQQVYNPVRPRTVASSVKFMACASPERQRVQAGVPAFVPGSSQNARKNIRGVELTLLATWSPRLIH